jgi:hypothetical protein
VSQRSHYRLQAMAMWLNLVPKLHQAGSNNIYPRHNTFSDHDDPNMYAGVVKPDSSIFHGYQVSKSFVTQKANLRFRW